MIPSSPRRTTWANLLSHPDVVEASELGSRVGIMAFHAGLEGGTLEIAEAAAAASGASLYSVTQPAGLRWHVPSHSVDPDDSPTLAEWLEHVDVAIALHGYGRIASPRRILLGGTNRRLASIIASVVACRLDGFEVVSDLPLIPPELRGLHPRNPVNRPILGGVQVELPPSARGTSVRPPDPSWGPGGAPARISEAVADAIRSWETTAADGS